MKEISSTAFVFLIVLLVLHVKSFQSEEFQENRILRQNLKQKCQNYGGISRRKVCCASSCGKCGGRGCGRRPGGKSRCCGSRIKRTCGVNGQRAPCIIDESICGDALAKNQCKRLKSRGKCESSPVWAKTKCKKTCGHCDTDQTVAPTNMPKPTTNKPELTNQPTKPPNATEPPLITTTPSKQPCIGSTFNFNNYFGWKSHMDYLECLKQRYSDRCEIIDIGKSVEGRSIKVIKIHQPSSNGQVKPAIWIDGGIHAREWISHSSVEYFVYQLVEKLNLPQNKRMVNNFDIYVAPILNPDGYEYTRTNDRYWRKNRSKNSGSNCKGVDLNRNWGYKWGGKGASRNPCSETYRGSKAFSEPETKAVRDFILSQNQKQNFKMYLTYHSYGQYVLYGWGYKSKDPPNVNKLRQMANVGANAMKKENGGSRYSVGGAAKLLYAASGGSDDWALGSGGFQYSYTIELPPKGGSGFVLPRSKILPVGKEMHAGVVAMVTKLINDSN